MVLLILGLIIFFVGQALHRGDINIKKFSGPVRLVGLVVIALGVLTACVIQIEAGQVGVQKLFGKVQTEVLNSGLHFINPLVDVVKLDIKTQNYTMSGVQDEGHKAGDDAIRVLSADGLEVTIDLSVLYRVVPNEHLNCFLKRARITKTKLFVPLPVPVFATMPFITMRLRCFPAKETSFSNVFLKPLRAISTNADCCWRIYWLEI